MEVDWLLVIHCLVTLLVIVSFACGQRPIFEGTFIQKIHLFLTFGACDYFRRFVGAVLGRKGSDILFCVEHYCCDRPNPSLRIIYLGIIGVSYYFIVQSSFKYIPGLYLGKEHRYLSLLAVGGGILLFLFTSFSDPGTVNDVNVSQYLSAYPYDNIIFSEKVCRTCKIPKPARSKHCRICNRCVARFDHHCGWMNNCIGEKNTRYFMAFVVWHFLLSLYGTVAIALVLLGRLKEVRVIDILTVYYGLEESFSSLALHVVVWLLDSHNTQILIMVFLAIVSMLLGGFLAYHTKLCVTNTTTNETFKWQEYLSWKRKVNEAKASAAGELYHVKKSKWKTFFQRSHIEQVQVVKNNIYDKGMLQNVFEILVPLSTRRSFLHRKSKSR